MQATPSEAVSQAPVLVPEPDPSSQHGMETEVQQVTDTEMVTESESERGVREGEGGQGDDVITVHVESSETQLPSTSESSKVVKPVMEPVLDQPETMAMTSSAVTECEEVVTVEQIVTHVSNDIPLSPTTMGSGFAQTTLEQADTTQEEGTETDVTMDTGVVVMGTGLVVETAERGEEIEEEENESTSVERGTVDEGIHFYQDTFLSGHL